MIPPQAHITYFDFADIHYSSYFVHGFLEHAKRGGYSFAVSQKEDALLRELRRDPDWRVRSVLLFKLDHAAESFYFCIDTRDSARPGRDRGIGFQFPLLESVRYYFKVNYDEDVVAADPALAPWREKIHPAGLFIPLRPDRWWHCLPRTLRRTSADWTARAAARRVAHLGRLASLDAHTKLRRAEKRLDIFFVVPFYGEDVHRQHNEFRRDVIRELRRRRDIEAVAGFGSTRPLLGAFDDLRLDRYSFDEYLRALAGAKVAIYVRGVHDCLSFKLGQYFALGLPVAGQEIACDRSRMYRYPRVAEQFAFSDPRELVDAAVELARDTDRRDELAALNARTFDEHLNPVVAVDRIVRTMWPGSQG